MFTTPFVVVLGCSQPPERTTVPSAAPAPTSDTQTSTASVPLDATTVDAAVASAVPEDAAATDSGTDAPAPIARKPSRCELDPYASGCNPPPPRILPIRAQGRVLALRPIRPYATEIDVEIRNVSFVGSRTGHGVFLDDSGQPIEGTEFKILSVSPKNVALCRAENDLMNIRSRRVEVFGERQEEPEPVRRSTWP